MVDPWKHWPTSEYVDGLNAEQLEQDRRYESVQQMAMTTHANSGHRTAVLKLTSEEAAVMIPDNSLAINKHKFIYLLLIANLFILIKGFLLY